MSENITDYMSKEQLDVVKNIIKHGEEGQYYQDIIMELQETFDMMPVTYGQDGKGDAAIVYLHYFLGGSDWWITEKDMMSGQQQAFGFVCLNGDKENAELGYINLKNVADVGAELDFHFMPRPLSEIKEAEGIVN
jgi:hypothetical protein